MKHILQAMGKKPVYTEQETQDKAKETAKKFLTDLAQSTSFFSGEIQEGNSIRRQKILADRFEYFIMGNLRTMRSPVGELTLPLVEDFISRYFKYQQRNNKTMSLFEVCQQIKAFKAETSND